MSTALMARNTQGVLNELATDWTGTTYSIDSTYPASTIDVPNLTKVLDATFANQTGAVKDVQWSYSSCGYVYSHWVYMINSAEPSSRVIMEGLSLDYLDPKFQTTSTIRFVSSLAPESSEAYSAADGVPLLLPW